MQPTKAPSSHHWSQDIYEILKEHRVSVVPIVPDAGHTKLIQLCQSDAAIHAVSLTTEEEGVALALGSWLGGARSALLMQSSGVGNCINMFSLIKTCGFPFLTFITMRGEWGEFNPWQVPMGQATPSVLSAMGLNLFRADHPSEVREVATAAAKLAFGSSCGVAVLLSQRLIGTKQF